MSAQPVLILGAAGLLGGAAGALLSSRGVPVRALVRSRAAADRLAFAPSSVVLGDLTEGLPPEALEGVAAVAYMAASSVPADSPGDPRGEFSRTLPALNGVLSALAEKGGRIVFPSSGGSVYGERAEPADEGSGLSPRSSYALGKVLAEETVRFYGRVHGVGFDILRFTNVYGSPHPRLRPQGVIDVFLDDALAGRPSTVWGSLQVERDFLFVDDAAEAVVAVLARPASHAVYNVGAGRTRSLDEVLQAISAATGGRHVWTRRGDHDAGVARSAVNVDRFVADHRWRPAWDLEAGVAETWARKQAAQAASGSARP